MLNKNKTYTFKELNNLYNMLNIEFKYFGQNSKGDLILYMLDKLLCLFQIITVKIKNHI